MKNFSTLIKGLHLFSRAYNATKHQIGVSIMLLAMVTLAFALLMWIAEGSSNPDFSFWDALVWTFVKYVEDPADITTSPITVFGQIVGTMVGVLGIAIFAVPAGLIGSGLMDAMDEKRHEEEIEEYYHRMKKVFRRAGNRNLRHYLDALPEKGGQAYARLNFVPQFIPVSRLQIRQGMDLKDVFEVCRKYPEFRMKNLAEAIETEGYPDDRFVVNSSPLNTAYGCCINRNSKVTIVCPVGYSETGTGWFSYYLAKLGGFNYISKDLEVDEDELDSFFNLSKEPLYDKKNRAEHEAKKNKKALQILQLKEERRSAFMTDLSNLTQGADSWMIVMAGHLKHAENNVDFHLSHCKKDNTNDTIHDASTYQQFITRYCEELNDEFGLETVTETKRFPLGPNNLIYRMREKCNFEGNAFTLWPSTNLMVFDNQKLIYAYKMARIISEALDNNKGVEQADIDDFAGHIFGFSENAEPEETLRK